MANSKSTASLPCHAGPQPLNPRLYTLIPKADAPQDPKAEAKPEANGRALAVAALGSIRQAPPAAAGAGSTPAGSQLSAQAEPWPVKRTTAADQDVAKPGAASGALP